MPPLTDIAQTTMLNNGVEMPWLGLGTWQATGADAAQAVRWALEAGYRHIDTAAAYNNEEAIGQAVRESDVDRDDIFITTKLWNGDQKNSRQREAFEQSLRRLGTDYIDLYLAHWPVEGKSRETWAALESLLATDKVRAIGVSNYMPEHLEPLLLETDVTPAVNQVQFHPHRLQSDAVAACRKHQIQVEGYSPLMQGKVTDIEALERIAEAHGKTSAQVVIRWSLQHGVVTIPKSTHQGRIEQNADVFDFELTDEQMQAIDALGQAG